MQGGSRAAVERGKKFERGKGGKDSNTSVLIKSDQENAQYTSPVTFVFFRNKATQSSQSFLGIGQAPAAELLLRRLFVQTPPCEQERKPQSEGQLTTARLLEDTALTLPALRQVSVP
jgi:hypothetical protein